MPLALLYLKAYLVDREGHEADDVRIVEFERHASVEEIVRDIENTDPEILGLSCYVWNVEALLAAAQQIKQRRPTTRIVVGGPEVGPIASDVLLRHPFIDVVVRSEGEVPLAEIIGAWRAGRALDEVKGISFRKGGSPVDTEDAPIVNDLSQIPSPHFRGYGDYTGRIVCIETQRGCVFRCNFCFYNKDFSVRNRRFDLDRVKEEIQYWLDQDVAEIYLMDPVFNLNAVRAKEICRFLAERNRRRLPIHAEIWAEFVDDEMACAMRDANFQFLEVGLQTTDTTALMTADRRLKVQRFLEGIGHLKRYKLPFELQLIYGLPGETRASFRKSLNFAMTLDPPVLEVFRLMVLPGTELWRNRAGLQLTFDPAPPYFARSHFSMSTDDFDYGRDLIGACSRLAGSRTIRLLAKERDLTFADLIDDWLDWVKSAGQDIKEHDRLPRFIAQVCEERAIPAPFYQQFAALEFDRPPHAVQR
jgi:radical SAM superfamily enzyme YgiQ (UPF0313 family)